MIKCFLDMDFASDMYLVADGEPASLLLRPDSFHALLAPLPSTIDQICFRWSSFPLDGNKVSTNLSKCLCLCVLFTYIYTYYLHFKFLRRKDTFFIEINLHLPVYKICIYYFLQLNFGICLDKGKL